MVIATKQIRPRGMEKKAAKRKKQNNGIILYITHNVDVLWIYCLSEMGSLNLFVAK